MHLYHVSFLQHGNTVLRKDVASCCRLPRAQPLLAGECLETFHAPGDRHEDGCSLVSCSVVARSIRKRRRPGPFNAAAGCAATATECSAADRAAAPGYCPGTAGPRTGATEPRASATERARTAAAAGISDAARFVGTAKSATAVVPSVAEIPVPLDAAVAAAAAVPFSDDTSGTSDDAPSSSEAVWSAAVGALRIDGQ
jgi:hypothetical protein